MSAERPVALPRAAGRLVRVPSRIVPSRGFRAFALIVAALLPGAGPAADAGVPPDAAGVSGAVPLDIGSQLQLLVDRTLIEKLEGATLLLHAPCPREVVFHFDAPWEGPMSAYVTVLRDGDRYRMYYRGGGETTEEVACMAESRDGIRWARPSLGLFEYPGRWVGRPARAMPWDPEKDGPRDDANRDNNIVFRGRGKAYWEAHNFTVFIDANPRCDPAARYKALGLGRHVLPDGEDVKALVALGSPDGIHWKHLREAPIITQGSFDSQNVAFWDEVLQKYVCYLRHGREGTRSIQRSVSADFLEWSRPAWLELDDPLEHFYTNAIVPYFREPHWYLGFPMRFVPERKTIGWPPRKVDGLSDAVLISSRDGLRFERTFREAFLRPGLDPGNWGNAHGNNTPAWGLLPTAPGEISIYWCENYGDVPRLRRGTLRTDGFASLHAPRAGGEAVTRAFVFSGTKLVLNVSTSAVGSVRVELQDADGRAVPGRGLGDADEIFGDEIERVVRWRDGDDIGGLAGRTVRLRFSLADADIYSFRFR